METRDVPTQALTVTDLCVDRGHTRVVNEVSVSLADGESVALQGRSGAGKSTLLRAIAGLIPVASGEVRLDGERATTMGMPQFRRQVIYVAQTPAQLPGTACDWLDDLAQLRQVGALHEASMDIGAQWDLDEPVWQRPFSGLSGGEKQRIMLAIALAAKPRVLLLDEPTSGLDQQTLLKVEASLRGRTSVWVTHDAEQAERVAQRTVVLP